jgi:hypothetical protein
MPAFVDEPEPVQRFGCTPPPCAMMTSPYLP